MVFLVEHIRECEMKIVVFTANVLVTPFDPGRHYVQSIVRPFLVEEFRERNSQAADAGPDVQNLRAWSESRQVDQLLHERLAGPPEAVDCAGEDLGLRGNHLL